MIAIGESLRDVFYFIHEATVHCSLQEDNCQLCLNYAEKIPVDRVVKVPAAGNSANAAVCASRLGLTSTLVTWIGDDNAGQLIHEHLTTEGVHTSHVITDRKHPTSESTILNFQGEKTQLVYFQPRNYILPKKLPNARSVYYSAMGNHHSGFDLKLIAYLRAHPKPFFAFQPGSTHIKEGLTPAFKKLVARSDLFILNREEAAALLQDGDAVEPRIRAFHKIGAKRVIITDGKNGSTGSDGSGLWFMPAFPIKPIETTGAGDSFAATVTCMLLMGKSFEEAMHAGSAMASNVIEHIGPQAGLLRPRELHARMKRYTTVKPARLKF